MLNHVTEVKRVYSLPMHEGLNGIDDDVGVLIQFIPGIDGRAAEK